MKNFHRIAQGIDVNPLLLAIKRRPGLWKEDTYLRDYPQGPFGDVESIILRFPTKGVYETEEELENHLSRYDQHECIDYPAFVSLPESAPLIFNLAHYVSATRIGRAIINKIEPGGRIFPHADTPVHAEYWERHHIVLQSEPGNLFTCGDESVQMRTGEIWWFENSVEHEVINNSKDDRIHLVLDLRCSQ